MPDAIITSTASTFGTISGTFAADQSTITGTVTGVVVGTLSGSVGVPGPQGPTGATGATGATGPTGPAGSPGVGVPVGGTAGQFLTKTTTGVDYATNWSTLSLAGYATESWVTAGFYPLTGNPSGFLTSAPVTSVAGRTGAITLSNTDISGLGTLAVVNDAPSDGSQYARKNAAWDVVIPGDRYLTSSTTSNTVSNGNKTFTIGTGLSYTPTQNITISYDVSHHMHGEVLTYNSGTGVLTVDVNHYTGSGTYAAWVVNVGGVTPATSVAWGAITGTLSSQTDLQNALDLKLDVTTAASTYYLQTNPDGFITSAALTGYATETFVTSQGYITQSTADGLYYGIGNPSGFITAGDLAGYATESWVSSQDYLTNGAAASTYQTLSGMSSYASLAGALFTGLVQVKASNGAGAGLLIPTGTAPSSPLDGEIWNSGSLGLKVRLASVTETLANQSWVSNAYAPLASPTFSGSPSLPTGSIGVTQSPGNNTTALATTAFVTAAVPAFATAAQARGFTSTTTAINPRQALWAMLSQDVIDIVGTSMTVTNVGTIQTVNVGMIGRFIRPGTAGACSCRIRVFGPSQVDQTQSATVKTNPTSHLNFSLRSIHSGRSVCNGISSTLWTGAFYYGKAEGDGVGDLTRRGIGWKVVGGSGSRFLQLQVHNGTTLSSVTSSYAVTSNVAFDWDVESDGAGNVTLYVNGSSVATSTGGPTGLVNLSPVVWQEEVVGTGVLPSYSDFINSRGKFVIISP